MTRDHTDDGTDIVDELHAVEDEAAPDGRATGEAAGSMDRRSYMKAAGAAAATGLGAVGLTGSAAAITSNQTGNHGGTSTRSGRTPRVPWR